DNGILCELDVLQRLLEHLFEGVHGFLREGVREPKLQETSTVPPGNGLMAASQREKSNAFHRAYRERTTGLSKNRPGNSSCPCGTSIRRGSGNCSDQRGSTEHPGVIPRNGGHV